MRSRQESASASVADIEDLPQESDDRAMAESNQDDSVSLPREDWANEGWSDQRLDELATALRRPQPMICDRQAIDSLPLQGILPKERVANEYIRAHVLPRYGKTGSPGRSQSGGQILAWLLIVLGLLCFGAGSGLGARSLIAEIPRWWNVSLGLAMLGQGLLIFGLIMLLARLWEASRIANQRLGQAINQLSELQSTADRIAGRQESSPSAFYTHLTNRGSDELLRANLQGQIDQLMTRRRAA